MTTDEAELEQEELGSGEILEGYGCSCGFTTDGKGKFLNHIGHGQRVDGKDAHQTQGKINLLTGEVILPPYRERTANQLYRTRTGKERETPLAEVPEEGGLPLAPADSGAGGNGKGPKAGAKSPPTVLGTPNPQDASQIRFVPRVFTCGLTPIMLLGYEVARHKWGWRENMPFENYLDTVIYHYFFEHGTKLQAAVEIISEEEIEQGG